MTIKETAGKILLVIYSMQTTDPVFLQQSKITFITYPEIALNTDDKFRNILISINSSEVTLYNSFNYLLEKGLIARRNSRDAMGAIFLLGLYITSDGIDIIEGVERDEESQKIIKSLFNLSFNFSPTMKVDSLIKSEIGNIVGIGGAISGKIGA